MAIHGDHAYFYRHDAYRDLPRELSTVSLHQRVQLLGRFLQTANRVEPYVVERVLEKLVAKEKAVFWSLDLQEVHGQLRERVPCACLEVFGSGEANGFKRVVCDGLVTIRASVRSPTGWRRPSSSSARSA